MSNRITKGGLQISSELYRLVEQEILPGTGVDLEQMWAGFESLVNDMGSRNRALLDKRERLQAQLDSWYAEHQGDAFDVEACEAFLRETGYLLPEGEDFTISPQRIDEEIARVAGPQLVVPVSNARFALNAANARWGSLYDALYGTNVIDERQGWEKTAEFNPERGAQVVKWAAEFLDQAVPLDEGSHRQVVDYRLNAEGGTYSLSIKTCRWHPHFAQPAGAVCGLHRRRPEAEYSAAQSWAACRAADRSRQSGWDPVPLRVSRMCCSSRP